MCASRMAGPPMPPHTPYPPPCGLPRATGPHWQGHDIIRGARRLEVPTASKVSHSLTNFTAENSL